MDTDEDVVPQAYTHVMHTHIAELAAQAAIPIQLVTPLHTHLEPLPQRTPACDASRSS